MFGDTRCFGAVGGKNFLYVDGGGCGFSKRFHTIGLRDCLVLWYFSEYPDFRFDFSTNG